MPKTSVVFKVDEICIVVDCKRVCTSSMIIEALFDAACGLGARSLTQPTPLALVTCLPDKKSGLFIPVKSSFK